MNPAKQVFDSVVNRPSDVVSTAGVYLEDSTKSSNFRGTSEWLLLLWDARQSLWRATLIGLVLATLIAFLIPKTYESTTRLMPPDQESGSLSMAAALMGKAGLGPGSLAGNLLGVKGSGALFADILRSRTVQDRIIERFDLRKVYRDRYWETARRDLSGYTGIAEDRKSGVITISVQDHDPHRAAEIAQAYVEELDRLVAQVSTSAARRERIFIEQRLKTVQQDLDTASQQFSEYASKNTAIDIKQQGVAMVEAAARLQGELIAAQSEAEGLEQIYTSNNVRVRSIRARISELKRQLEKLGGDSTNTGVNVPTSLQQLPSIRNLPILGVRWAELYRETKIQETVYELLTQQYELAKIEEAKEIPTVKILDLANVPERKSEPHRLVLMILGTLLAFSASTTWVLGAAVWQRMPDNDVRKIMILKAVAPLRFRLLRLQDRTGSGVGALLKKVPGRRQSD